MISYNSKPCPLLLRVFMKEGSFHDTSSFISNSEVPEGEANLHVWKHSTLRDIVTLLKENNETSRKKDIVFEIRFIGPNEKGLYNHRYIGSINSSATKKTDLDSKTLQDLNFNYEFISICLKNTALPSPSTTTTSLQDTPMDTTTTASKEEEDKETSSTTTTTTTVENKESTADTTADM
ncbi:hypothetical protein CYY_005440 [Polysphondylium violaceum]|uniref:Uncharacterized protein n=1 Tax=Polysphondylium violaceum TaxID=133409 RepID=A0A8J4UZL4_9MYCE|nr:hypothetical protein CYY_005440 [Polysphondylium violaceum]